MNCPGCQVANPAAARFCLGCGAALPSRCRHCQTELPTGARFCMGCGKPIQDATAADEQRQQPLAATAPGVLTEKRPAARLGSERRVMTVLFADVVGSTALAERMDPEDWTRIMNGAFDRLGAAVYRYEGEIARLMGDALLAFFGAREAHEDDPARAVHAALDMLAAARTYAAEIRGQYGIEFAIRVGLNTGPVVVGMVGSDRVREFTAMGDAVNLAARMQGAAQPMSVLLAEQTYRHIRPLFECRDVGLLEVKGKTALVRAYEVLAPRALPGRVRGLAGQTSTLVGRQTELTRLLEAAETVQAGVGRGVAIVGEPGLGKSRLIAELRGALAARGVLGEGGEAGAAQGRTTMRWLEAHCLSYGRGMAYHLVVDLLRSILGVHALSDHHEIRDRLTRLLEDLFGSTNAERNLLPLLAHLLGLPLNEAATEGGQMLDPQTLQRQYMASLRSLLVALAARSPLVIVLDDIHWIDDSSAEVFGKLVGLACEAPILFCLVTRPDREAPGWRLVGTAREMLGGGFTEFSLSALSEQESRELLANLLAFEAIPEHLRRHILERAEGNPFFVEEVIRMLIDRGVLVRQDDRWIMTGDVERLDIPDNLQGLLMARIDRLPEEARRTLRVAAVIGRQFPVHVLERVLGQATVE